MFENLRKTTIYRSKDKSDWERAKAILKAAAIPMRAWESEEPPIAGCGMKADIRSFASKRPVPHRIYSIETDAENTAAAQDALKGRVLPVRSYGVMF